MVRVYVSPCTVVLLGGCRVCQMAKEWDKSLMWRQLGLPVTEYTDVEADLPITQANIKA